VGSSRTRKWVLEHEAAEDEAGDSPPERAWVGLRASVAGEEHLRGGRGVLPWEAWGSDWCSHSMAVMPR